MVSLDNHMEIQILFQTVTSCPPVCLVCFESNRIIPSLLSTTFSERHDWTRKAEVPSLTLRNVFFGNSVGFSSIWSWLVVIPTSILFHFLNVYLQCLDLKKRLRRDEVTQQLSQEYAGLHQHWVRETEQCREMLEESRADKWAAGPEIDRLWPREAELLREVQRHNLGLYYQGIVQISLTNPGYQKASQSFANYAAMLCIWKHQLRHRISPEILRQWLKVNELRFKLFKQIFRQHRILWTVGMKQLWARANVSSNNPAVVTFSQAEGDLVRNVPILIRYRLRPK